MREKKIKRSGGIRGRYEGQSFQPTPIVRGIVVNTKDDIYNIGRVQVRILNLHGTDEDGISDENLPWAKPCTLFSTHDGGSFLVPEVGTAVWLLFEDGDYTKPVYLGGSYGVGITTDRWLGKTDLSGRLQPVVESELPKQVINENTHVLFKSPTGKSIIVDDNDNQESIYVRDQLGQVISLESKMTESYKDGYEYKDTYKDDMRHKKFDDWHGLQDWCKITMKSLSHSLFSIISNIKKSIVNIKSKRDDSESNIELTSGEVKYIKAWVSGSNNRILIDDDKIEFVVDESTKVTIASGNIGLEVGGANYDFSSGSFTSSESILGSKDIVGTLRDTNQ